MRCAVVWCIVIKLHLPLGLSLQTVLGALHKILFAHVPARWNAPFPPLAQFGRHASGLSERSWNSGSMSIISPCESREKSNQRRVASQTPWSPPSVGIMTSLVGMANWVVVGFTLLVKNVRTSFFCCFCLVAREIHAAARLASATGGLVGVNTRLQTFVMRMHVPGGIK